MDNYNYMPNNYYGGPQGEAEEKAPNIFRQFAYSFVPPKYRSLAKVKTGSMIAFVTLLVLIFALASFVKVAATYSNLEDMMKKMLDEAPDFELKNGVFSIEESFEFGEGNTYIYITDEIDEFAYDQIRYLVNEEGYEDVLLVAKKGLYLYNNRKYQELLFKDISTFTFNKEWIINKLVPIIKLCVIVGYLFGFVFGTLWYFGCAAIYLLIAMLIAAIMGKSIPAGKLFRAAVYSKVFMYVIVKLRDLCSLGSVIPIPFWLRVALTIVFLCFAVYCMGKPGQPTADTEAPNDYSRYIY